MATYIDEMFDAKIVQQEGIVRRDKWSIDRNKGMFEKLLARCRKDQYHLIETGTQYVVLCNAGALKIYC